MQINAKSKAIIYSILQAKALAEMDEEFNISNLLDQEFHAAQQKVRYMVVISEHVVRCIWSGVARQAASTVAGRGNAQITCFYGT